MIERLDKNEKYDEAIELWNRLLEKDPDNFRIRNKKIFFHIKLEKSQSELNSLFDEMMEDFGKFKGNTKVIGSFAKSW